MKNTSYLLLSLLIFSCDDTPKQTQETIVKKEVQKENILEQKVEQIEEEMIEEKTTAFSFDDFKGFYVGEFEAVKYDNKKKPSYSNRINISIDSIDTEKEILFGHSVVAGNSRPFKGKYELDIRLNSIKVVAKEPGDDKYDGSFIMQISPNHNKFTGTWLSNDINLAVTERKFNLKKKKFYYNPNHNIIIDDDWGLPISGNEFFDSGEQEAITYAVTETNASVKELTNKDVENLSKGDLEVIRNLIYARHGYSFKNRRMRYFFEYGENADWYIPVSTDVRKELTKIEVKNIELIKRYEEHAEKYYDYFGR